MATILETTKKLLGITNDYTVFDQDIIIGINSAFLTLNELKVGPDIPFRVETGNEEWADFSDDPGVLSGAIQYVWLKTRLAFDPPTSSFVVDAIKNQISELEFRLNALSE